MPKYKEVYITYNHVCEFLRHTVSPHDKAALVPVITEGPTPEQFAINICYELNHNMSLGYSICGQILSFLKPKEERVYDCLVCRAKEECGGIGMMAWSKDFWERYKAGDPDTAPRKGIELVDYTCVECGKTQDHTRELEEQHIEPDTDFHRHWCDICEYEFRMDGIGCPGF